jgi:ribosomal protein S18 acetylase RimI-like enzyme
MNDLAPTVPDVQIRSLGFQTDLALLRLGGSEIADLGDHLAIRSPHNPTHWWGNFLLLSHTPEEADVDGWLGRFHATFPDARHVALGFDGAFGSVEDLAPFSARGLEAEAQIVMTASDVHEPAHRAERAELRPLSTDGDWAQSVELRVRCRDEVLDLEGHRTFAAAKALTNRAIVENGDGAWFGAFVDGRLACQMGLLVAGPGLARFQSVETDPEFRRRGLAGSLVHFASCYGFEHLGAQTLVMVADPNYFAIDLYRAVGFQPTESQLQVERSPA